MANKSYLEIIHSCKLLDYVNMPFLAEIWQDDAHEYTCVWLPENLGKLPTTIKQRKYEH